MRLLENLLQSLPDGDVLDVRIGLHWTAVVVNRNGEKRCGLASTLAAEHSHHRREPEVPDAGELTACSARQLAQLALQGGTAQTSVGLAAINALLPVERDSWFEANAEQVIASQGAGKRVVLVGHFPFTGRLAEQVGKLAVLEQNPGPGDYPAEQAPSLVPRADVVAITAMTLSNNTLDGLLALCAPESYVILLGPSSPLSPLLFDYGIDMICGSDVVAIEPVLRVVTQGGNFRQVHRAGVNLVNMQRRQGRP
jgi:uncharacterized protein (DUF4213/DUF364 family)